MEQNDRLDRIERGIEKLEAEMKEVRGELSGIRESIGRIEGALPHFATKAEVEEAKHEATRGKYGMLISLIAVAFAALSLITRIWV